MALADRSLVFRFALAGTLVAALSLSACGRKGPVEPPPHADANGAEKGLVSDPDTGKDDDGKPARPDKTFFLDPLI